MCMCVCAHVRTFHKDKCKIADDPPRTSEESWASEGPWILRLIHFMGTSDCVHIPSCKLWLHFTQQRKRAPVLAQMLSPCWGRGRRKNQMGQGQSPEKPPGRNWNRLLRRDRTRRESRASQAVGLLSPLLKAAGRSLDSGPLLKINFPRIGACHHCWELACDSYTLGYTMYNACWIASHLN